MASQKKKKTKETDRAGIWFDDKSALMEERLGREHDMVMHAIIPFAVGGGLDLYYYPNGIPGTAMATKELSEKPKKGSSNDVYRCYELVMFTRRKLDMDAVEDESSDFGRIHTVISAVLNCVARYSFEAKLNPSDTCEFPEEMDTVGGRCLIFDGYPSCPEEKKEDFGLLAVIEVFRSEMEYAQKHGGAKLIGKLKAKGHYPYSDLDREPVV